jgi:hypothetical protein
MNLEGNQTTNQSEPTFSKNEDQDFELPHKGKKRPAEKSFSKKRANRENEHGGLGRPSTYGGLQHENNEPTKFRNDGTLCWLNSLIHLFFFNLYM